MSFDADQIIMYQTEDGVTKIDVHMEDETVWLNQNQMAELFQRDRSVISKHIKNVFDENEVDEKSNVHFLHIANADRPVDITVAKNYLKEDEISILNRLVSAYLEFAELQAIRQKPMYMKDWIQKLDDFITMSGSELLENAGNISHEQAKIKAELEFEKYQEKNKDELSKVEQDFLESIKETQKMLEGKGG